MPIFDDRERTDSSPKSRTEGLFQFYDRSSRPAFAVFRRLVNEWVGAMPEGVQRELEARMRAGGNLGFASGLAEIIMHEVMRCQGYSLQPHPDVPGTANHPDFLVRRADGTPLAYLEVTTINPPVAAEARDKREAVVFEALNNAVIPEDLRLGYEVRSFGTASPSAKRIRAEVERWAEEHADEARASLVQQNFQIDDWSFSLDLTGGFKARPDGKRIAFRGMINGRVLGAVPSLGGLAKALDAKARKYGELDLPYIVAVFDCTDSIGWFRRDFVSNVAEVLFGSEQHKSDRGVERADHRSPDGWFGCAEKPRNNGVSAVLVFPDDQPWHLAEERGQPLLLMNPWASMRLTNGFLPVNEFVIDRDVGKVIPGRMMSELMDLPTPWPTEG